MIELARDPVVAVIGWLIVFAVLWTALPRRYRLLALTALGTAGAVVNDVVFPLLPRGPLMAFPEIGMLVADLTLVAAPVVLTIDRLMLRHLAARVIQLGAVASYGLAVGAGLVAALASVGALWWVNDVRPLELQGSVDIAIFTGVVTACVALVRVDRNVDALRAQPPSPVHD